MPASAEIFLNLANNSRIPLTSANSSTFNTAGPTASVGLVPQPDSSLHIPPKVLGDDGAWHFQSIWTPYSPVVTALAGHFNTVSAVGAFAVAGAITLFRAAITLTNTGNGTFPVFTLPSTPISGPFIAPGRENGQTGFMVQARIVSGQNTATVFNFNNGAPNSSGAVIEISGFYESSQT